jgi:hypothetical protein
MYSGRTKYGPGKKSRKEKRGELNKLRPIQMVPSIPEKSQAQIDAEIKRFLRNQKNKKDRASEITLELQEDEKNRREYEDDEREFEFEEERREFEEEIKRNEFEAREKYKESRNLISGISKKQQKLEKLRRTRILLQLQEEREELNIKTRKIIDILNQQINEDKSLNSNSITQHLKKANKVYKHQIIDSFICPITIEVMKDPVVTSDGITYERDAIQEVIDWAIYRNINIISPKSRTIISRELYPNIALRNMISFFLEESGLYEVDYQHIDDIDLNW